ncbi:MAG TPA: hypothetical protein PLD84_11930, partial [Chitinophagales bacterium]|nr:hypothetical protein [Chitinophagales bacterium]
MNLLLLLFLPLITSAAILFSKGLMQIRAIAAIGATIQLLMGAVLLIMYWQERALGNNAQMLFESSYAWFTPLNINFHMGVDGISIAMILLTAFVVLAGILVSWKEESISKSDFAGDSSGNPDSAGASSGKEFFFLLIFLSLGAYGFFISLDLFTMFF